jgi:phosphatidylinositol-3-phosphatase
MENKEYGDVIGSSEAPYLGSLAKRYALPKRVFAIRHPSLPNYLALIGGSTFGIDSDCTSCHVHAINLVDQLERAGIGWKAYMQGVPKPCYTGAEHGRYAKKHNPFMYFDDIRKNAKRCSRVVSDKALTSDLAHGRLPAFAWITPDLCNDTHDCGVATGDRFLKRLVPSLLRVLGPRGFLVLTYDEGSSDRGCCGGDAHGGRIATVIAGPEVRRGVRPAASYDQYSILQTIEDAFGVGHLRRAGAARTLPLDAVFSKLPRGIGR